MRFNKSRREWHVWKNNFFGDKEAKTETAQAIIDKAGIECDINQFGQSDSYTP